MLLNVGRNCIVCYQISCQRESTKGTSLLLNNEIDMEILACNALIFLPQLFYWDLSREG